MTTFSRETKFLFVFASCLCPHCNKVTAYGVAENSGSIAGFPFFWKQKEYVVGCTQCFSIRPIKKKALNHYRVASSKYQALLDNEITQDQFEQAINELPIHIYHQIQAEADGIWVCSHCKEENPHEFELCFNCGTESSLPPQQRSPATDLPHLGGGNPWEQ